MPVGFIYVLFVAAGITWIVLPFILMAPLHHAFSYHTDVRRRSLLALRRTIGRFILVFGSAFLVIGGLVLARPGAVALVILMGSATVGPALIAYRIALARDRKHRFDAEYTSGFTGPTTRW